MGEVDQSKLLILDRFMRHTPDASFKMAVAGIGKRIDLDRCSLPFSNETDVPVEDRDLDLERLVVRYDR